MASITAAAPQFLVENLDESLAFYEQRLSFSRNLIYEGFYASVSRDRAVIHLKCAPKLDAERAHRKSGDHLDAYLPVSRVSELYTELVGRGAPITRPLARQPWGTQDFYVEDPDGSSCVSRKPPDFRRIDGAWLVVHDHVSVPAEPEHGQAVLNLIP